MMTALHFSRYTNLTPVLIAQSQGAADRGTVVDARYGDQDDQEVAKLESDDGQTCSGGRSAVSSSFRGLTRLRWN
jgi:hypothetical protein